MITALAFLVRQVHARWESPRSPTWLTMYCFLHTVKGNAIPGPGAKEQKRSVPRSINATTTSTSTWHFFYAEHNKLTIEVGIRIFPKFPVTSVVK